MRTLCRFLVLDVFGSRYEYLVIPELHLALEYRPALVVLTPEQSDVIDLLLISCLLRIMLDMLASDSIRGQFICNLLPVALCLYIEVEAVFGISCLLRHNCIFEFYRLSLSPEGEERFSIFFVSWSASFFLFLHRLKHRRRGFRFSGAVKSER